MPTILDNLIKLKPEIDLGFEQKCPKCNGILKIRDFYIFGWRNLAFGKCAHCNKKYIFDMPSGHGIAYPSFIDIDRDKVYAKRGAEWFSKPFLEGWLHKNNKKISIRCIKNKKTKNKAIVINCFDIIYGHSLLKLLCLSYYLKNNYHKEYDIIVLVPKSLVYLLPPEVNFVIVTDVPFSEMKEFYVNIDEYLKKFFSRYDEIFLSPIPPHLYACNYDLKLFKLNEPNYAVPVKNICFTYRANRLWGLTLRSQQKRIEKIFYVIHKSYPHLKFFIIGNKDNRKFKARFIEDERVSSITQEVEKNWNDILFNSLVIGVHGSNMLIPSALAKYIIELVPESRYGNAIQASLLSCELDNFQILHKFRYIYGNEDLTDIDRVVEKIVFALLSEDFDNIALYYQNKSINWDDIQNSYSSVQYHFENKFFDKIKRKIILIFKKFYK